MALAEQVETLAPALHRRAIVGLQRWGQIARRREPRFAHSFQQQDPAGVGANERHDSLEGTIQRLL